MQDRECGLCSLEVVSCYDGEARTAYTIYSRFISASKRPRASAKAQPRKIASFGGLWRPEQSVYIKQSSLMSILPLTFISTHSSLYLKVILLVLHMRATILTLGALASFVHSQFPSAPNGLTTITSTLNPNVTISYKQVRYSRCLSVQANLLFRANCAKLLQE
jgi:hypothetical protein